MVRAPLADLDTESVRNVYVYVADALRYDELPDRVAGRALNFRGVAHGLATPQCMPSIVSGRLPPKHGATWFHTPMREDVDTLFGLSGVTTGYGELVWEGRAVREVLGDPPTADPDTVQEPFVLVEHDNGGHAPYAGMRDRETGEMYEAIPSRSALLARYRETVAGSVDRFEERLALLAERGVLDETLVVFLADHGELLGEHGGFVGHGQPMTPELVYVPVSFVHPSLPSGATGDHLLQAVDLYPTVVDLLTARGPDADGASLIRGVEPDRPAYSQGLSHPPTGLDDRIARWFDPGYDARGVWTLEGGHVFVENSRLVRALAGAYDATGTVYTGAFNADRNVLRTLASVVPHYLKNYHRYGDPSVSRNEARRFVDDTRTSIAATERRDLDPATEQHLERLGYR